MNSEGVAAVLTICVAIFFAGLFLGGMWATHDARAQAITAGVGHYVVDPKSGDTKFVYGAKP